MKQLNWTKIRSWMLIGCFATIVTVIVINYQQVQDQIIKNQLNFIDGRPSDQKMPEVTSLWQLFYNLDYTGQELSPSKVAFDQANGILAILDETNQKLLTLEQNSKRFESLTLPAERPTTALTWANDHLYAYAGSIFVYSKKDRSWQKITPDFEFPAPVKAIEKFGDNFYLFGDGLIRKVTFDSEDKYVGLESWLDPSEDLSFQPAGVYLDGHVYLADVNGKVTRYLRGVATPWKVKAELKGPQLITGSNQSLYLLSPEQEQLTILSNTGEVISQLQDPLLKRAQEVWFHPDQNTFYILIDRSIYAYSL